MITIKSKKEIEYMKEACKIVALVYQEISKNIKVGMTTWEIDKLAEDIILSQKGIPAEKGYSFGIAGVPDYPAATCISINDEVIHGIPSKDRYIKDGDIVSVDLVVQKNGFHRRCCKNIFSRKCFRTIKKIS